MLFFVNFFLLFSSLKTFTIFTFSSLFTICSSGLVFFPCCLGTLQKYRSKGEFCEGFIFLILGPK